MDDGALRVIERYGFNETVLNVWALLLVAAMALVLLTAPRRFAIVPFIVTTCFITTYQRIVVAGLDFDMIRLLLIVAAARIISRSEYRSLKLNAVDKCICFYVIAGIITYTLLWQTASAFINRLGWAYNIIGMYFVTRIFVRSTRDYVIIVKTMIIIAIPVMLAMLNEQVTGRNFFSIFGGVPEMTFLRDGRLRSQGAFDHPILAGTYGASLFPLVFGLWWSKRCNWLLFTTGITASLGITITSSSSGPLLAFAGGCAALMMWPLRKKMNLLIYSSVAALVVLQLVMNGPVWALIAKIGIVGGSTAQHRFALIDAAIRHFGEWWLLGTHSSAHWGWGLQDVTNMYINVAINNGLLGLLLFLGSIILCFHSFFRNVIFKKSLIHTKKIMWGLLAYFVTHLVSFLGVSYFGLFTFFWYLSLGLMATASDVVATSSRLPDIRKSGNRRGVKRSSAEKLRYP